MAFSRRHLPHWIPDDSTIFVTCRLAGSAPPTKREPGHIGPLWLQDPRIAGIVKDALLYGEAVRQFYRLDAWVIMPNHVHAIWQPLVSMPVIMRWLKGRTSRTANRILTEPSQLALIFGEIGQEGLDNFFAVSKRVSELLVVETYPLFSRG